LSLRRGTDADQSATTRCGAVSSKQWLKAIEELEADGLESPIVPNAFFDEEDQVHNHRIWGLSDGPKGGWSKGDDPLEYLTDPEPLGGPGSAPAPDRPCSAPTPLCKTSKER
jgi:hypothetical protein